MPARIERTYYARVDEVFRHMKKRGHSLESLAKAAPVSPVTLSRLLNKSKKKRRPGVMATFKKIADKLGVNPDTLIEGFDQPGATTNLEKDANRLQPAIDLAKAFDEFDETTELSKFMVKLSKVIGARATIYVVAITPGDSVIIRLNIEIDDLDSLLFHALRGHLKSLSIEAVLVPQNNPIIAALLNRYTPGFYRVGETATVRAEGIAV
jgi:transcriptional regulator with XRE-family HTH domain